MPLLRAKAQRVHHRGQAAAQPGRHDVVEQGERVGRRVQVVLTAADYRAQPVGGDHLVRAVVLRGPDRLPRPGRPDQHHQCGIGKRCHDGQDPRYASTARTRRWSESDGGSPSLLKMLLMCFSTARSDTTRWPAIALLERPSAMRASTSRSRAVSAARTLACRVAFSIPLTTSGSNAVPPAATRAIASTNSPTLATRSLSK